MGTRVTLRDEGYILNRQPAKKWNPHKMLPEAPRHPLSAAMTISNLRFDVVDLGNKRLKDTNGGKHND